MARPRNIPVIAFSTDANVASRGVYLSELFAGVRRRAHRAICSFDRKALVRRADADNPYGTVVEAAFRQDVARRSGQIVALEHYPHDNAGMAGPVRAVAQAAAHADALFLPDGGDAVPGVIQMLVADGMNAKRIQLLGTGLWDDPRIYATPALDGGGLCGPGCRRLSELLRPLPQALQQGPGAHRDARL